MAIMDVFNHPFFSPPTLTAAIERVQYVPQYLGSLGIFDVEPINTRALWLAMRGGNLTMIPTSPLGAPPRELDPESSELVALRTTRLAKGFTMYAHEIEGLLQFGNPNNLVTLQGEYLRRMGRVQEDRELTEEFHRLGAVQGVLLDADGTSVIYDFFEEFEITRPAPVVLDLANTAAPVNLRLAFNEFTRAYVRSSGGAITTNSRLHALAGDDFYDALVTHPDVERYYQNQMQRLLDQGLPFDSFTWGGVTWHNYRGTDDNTAVAIPTDEARMFPVGARAFAKAQSPAEFDPFINTMGRDAYMFNIPDRERGAFTRGELYTYPLYYCRRPDLLRTFTLA